MNIVTVRRNDNTATDTPCMGFVNIRLEGGGSLDSRQIIIKGRHWGRISDYLRVNLLTVRDGKIFGNYS